MKRIIAYMICIVLVISGYIYSNTIKPEPLDSTGEIIVKGKVLGMEKIADEYQETEHMPGLQQWQVEVQIKTGPFASRTVSTTHYYGDNPAFDFIFSPGDEVILSLDVQGNELENVYISDLSRDKYLKLLSAVFLVAILLIGGWQGVNTIISLLLTGLAVAKILLPAILAGKDPITATIITCTGVTVITHMLVTGFTRKSTAAISGTFFGIMVSGLIAKYVILLAHINGLGSEDSRMFFFSYGNGELDVTGILFAGIVLGSLGAVMDVAMSIASSVQEIHHANPSLSCIQLARKGMNVGRDIIGTMANTLILANAGTSLPLMLLILANDIPQLKIFNLDMIATEIIRALSGSIGLFMAVPFTALISALLFSGKTVGKRTNKLSNSSLGPQGTNVVSCTDEENTTAS